MKPLTLEIAGLNSFRKKQTIDFERLLDHGIFGIFGPTGSGKSSILDAITLALYGRVKRAANGKSGIINVREKTCTVSFTFELDTDGARRRYTIERVLGRASGRPDGVQTKKARLIEHDGDTPVVTADRQAEIDERMLELLGIDYQEFLSAVVLPQGAFADFLALKPAERARALQRLFGLHEFGQRLQIRLKSVLDEIRADKAGLEGRLGELRAFDDDAVATAAERCVVAEAVELTAREASLKADDACAVGETLMTLIEERRELLREHELAPERTAKLEGLRARIESAERGLKARPHIEAFESAAARVLRIQAEYNLAREGHSVAEAALSRARERHGLAEARFAADHDRLQKEESALEEIVSRRRRAADERDALALVRARTAELDENLMAAREHSASIRSQVDSCQAALRDLESRSAELEVSQEAVEELNELRLLLAGIRERSDSVGAREEEVERARDAVAHAEQRLVAKAAERERSASELAVARAEILVARQAADAADASRECARGRLSSMKSVLENLLRDEEECGRVEKNCAELRARLEEQDGAWVKISHRFSSVSERKSTLAEQKDLAFERWQDALRSSAVATLAPTLRDGEACPLCGSLEHPGASSAANHNDAVDIAALEADYVRITKELGKVDEDMHGCSHHMATIQNEKANLAATLERDTLALTTVRTRLRDGLIAAGEDRELASPADLDRYVAELARAVDEADIAVRNERARAAEQQERIDTLSDAQTRLSEKCAALEAEIATKRAMVREIEASIATLRADLDARTTALAARSGGRRPEGIEAEVRRLQEQQQAQEHVRRAMENERKKLATAQRELDGAAEAVNNAQRAHDQSLTIQSQKEDQLQSDERETLRRLESLCAPHERERDASSLLRERKTLREALERELAAATAELGSAATEEKGQRTAVEHHWTALCRDGAERDKLEDICNATLRKLGLNSIAEARSAMLDDAELDRARADARALEEALRHTAEALHRVEASIAGRTITSDQLDLLRASRVEARAALEATIGEAASARSGHAMTVEQNAAYHAVTDRNAGLLERERTALRLAGYLQGDAFVNFLADERLGDVCVRASRLLQELTGGRLELLSRSNEGFIIRDVGNGSVERSPGSLSGGETFLVSLSLALALSDTIQLGRSPLEFFFLDEGFGSLDDELLEVVVGALERLRSQRRTIGLITHVSLLRERIPRRLIVTRASERGGSTVAYEAG